ncbi:type VII secretion target [Streptacidiphilus griseoplanus]|uniref:type VII secretion target n=1 Tax=Peterkaempfera griseoplana TaxID=66896 RepID=UPI0006E1375D|nr:type VII secretion target [Peterkaempfera griseoplana]
MSQDVAVNPADLRASASAADAIAEEMKEPNDRAVAETAAAARTMSGWPLAAALDQLATGWKSALQGMHDRVTAGAGNLRSCADGHEWNDDLVADNFENFDDHYDAG